MNNSLRRRIELLEQRTSCDPIVLSFVDGTQKIIKGTTAHWQALNAALFEREEAKAGGIPAPVSALSVELAWLEDAEQISGTNAQMFALTKALCGFNDEGSE